MTTYEIIVTVSQATLDALKDGDFALYGFKAVRYGFRDPAARVTIGGGEPVIWFVNTSYLNVTTIDWPDAVQAFISATPIVDRAVIKVGDSEAAELGQIVTVSSAGTLSVTSGGMAGRVTIDNAGTTPWTCGLSQAPGPAYAPVCAFPLYGAMTDMIAPVERVLLCFAVNVLSAGTVVETAFNAGLLVDFDGATSRAVGFDINAGWSWGAGTWATPVATGADLADLLILT